MSSTTPRIRPLIGQNPNTLGGMVDQWMNTPVVTMFGYISLFAVAFGNLIDVESNNDAVGFGGQALVKVMFLALGGLYGGIGVVTDIRVRRLLFAFPMMWMSLLLFFFLYCDSKFDHCFYISGVDDVDRLCPLYDGDFVGAVGCQKRIEYGFLCGRVLCDRVLGGLFDRPVGRCVFGSDNRWAVCASDGRFSAP